MRLLLNNGPTGWRFILPTPTSLSYRFCYSFVLLSKLRALCFVVCGSVGFGLIFLTLNLAELLILIFNSRRLDLDLELL